MNYKNCLSQKFKMFFKVRKNVFFQRIQKKKKQNKYIQNLNSNTYYFRIIFKIRFEHRKVLRYFTRPINNLLLSINKINLYH